MSRELQLESALRALKRDNARLLRENIQLKTDRDRLKEKVKDMALRYTKTLKVEW
jgi:hypothetical protein